MFAVGDFVRVVNFDQFEDGWEGVIINAADNGDDWEVQMFGGVPERDAFSGDAIYTYSEEFLERIESLSDEAFEAFMAVSK